jgi:hypothetical protein
MSYDLKIKNGDLVIQGGDLTQVTNSDKLTQDILKICLTDVGSNPIHPSYGSFLSRSVIGNANKTSMIVQIAQSQINTCLTNLQSLQQTQLKTYQQMTADEQLAAVLGISIQRNAYDPRLYTVKIKVMTKGIQAITTEFTINTL